MPAYALASAEQSTSTFYFFTFGFTHSLRCVELLRTFQGQRPKPAHFLNPTFCPPNPALRTVDRRRDRIARCALRKGQKPSGCKASSIAPSAHYAKWPKLTPCGARVLDSARITAPLAPPQNFGKNVNGHLRRAGDTICLYARHFSVVDLIRSARRLSLVIGSVHFS